MSCKIDVYHLYLQNKLTEDEKDIFNILRCKSKDLQNILEEIKRNIKDFNVKFRSCYKFSFELVRRWIRKIIPKQFFGIDKNFKLMMKLVYKILTTSSMETIRTTDLIMGWNVQEVSWLEDNNEKELIIVIKYILEVYVKQKILKKLFYNLRDTKSFRVCRYPKTLFEKYRDKTFEEMVRNKFIIPSNRPEEDSLGMLRLHPKKKFKSFRMIVTNKIMTDIDTIRCRDIIRKLQKKYTRIFSSKKLYELWSNFVERVGSKNIYGCKVDILDAFGNVNLEKLKYILKNKEVWPRNQRHYFDRTLYNKILEYLNNQTFHFRKSKTSKKYKIWEWKHGLLQGTKLSPILCHVYREHFDNTYLRQFAQPHNFLHRTVDDYFFCSTDPVRVLHFLHIMKSKEKLNEEKTVLYTDESNADCSEIIYRGQIFCLKTKEVKIYVPRNFKARFKSRVYFKYTEEDEIYLKTVLDYKSNNIFFQKILLNLKFNSKQTFIENLFRGFIVVAHKLDCAVQIRWSARKLPENFPLMLSRVIFSVIKTYCIYIKKQMKTPRKKNSDSYSKTMWVIGLQSFILVLHKRFLVYKETIKLLKELRQENSTQMSSLVFRRIDLKKIPSDVNFYVKRAKLKK